MKAYILKYALTKGIIEVECDEPSEQFPGMIKWGVHNYAHGEGRQWARTREAAVGYADRMRKRKIASLRKAIERLDGMRFDYAGAE